MNQAQIEGELAELADELEQIDTRREQIYRRRLDLWVAGRTLPTPMKQRELAEPSRVTEGAVTQALRKLDERTNGKRKTKRA